MSEFERTFSFFKENSLRQSEVKTWDECKIFFADSTFKDWIYLIKFSDEIYAWGTASKDGLRLRKSSIFHKTLSGKYDRRVDYLMLKIIYGTPTVHLFELKNNARGIEQNRRVQIYGNTSKGACIRGFVQIERRDISVEIYNRFKKTPHFLSLSPLACSPKYEPA